MVRFKEFVGFEWLTFQADGVSVHILFSPSECRFLAEAKHRGLPIGGQYSAQLHRAHISGAQDHLHVYAKNNELFAINLDGTAHDRSHGVQIPNRVAAAISQHFPQFVLPPNNFIESASDEVNNIIGQRGLLLG